MSIKARIVEKDLAVDIDPAYSGTVEVPMFNEDGNPYSGSIVIASTVTANPSDPTFTDTDVNTTTNIVTVTAHGLTTGMAVTLTTSSTLPAPLLVATTYYVIVVTANTIKFASSAANAAAGTAIDLTTAGGAAATQTIVVTAVGFSYFVDASNDGVSYAPYYSLEGLTTTQVFQWLLSPNFKFYQFRKVVTGGVVACTANILLLGEAP